MSQISKLAVILTGNIAGFSAAMKKAGADVAGFSSQVESAGSRFASFTAGLLGIVGAAGSLAGLGTGLKLAADYEQATVAMGTMLGSTEKAKALLENLSQFAAETPFEFPELLQASRQLVAFGFGANEIMPNLKALGDIAAGIGMPVAELAELYGKARVQGRLFAVDINQLTNRGIPIIGALAKQFGVTEGEIKGMVEAGQVSFANLQQAFVDMTSKGGQFAGMMEAQSGTLGGLFSTLKDNVSMALRQIGQTLVEQLNIKEGMKALIEWLGQFGKKVAGIVTVIVRWAKANWETIATWGKWIGLITASIWAINKFIAIGGAIIRIIQLITKSQIIMLAFSGPKGWAMLAAGALVAYGAYKGIGAAFEGLSEEAAKVAAESNKAATAQEKVADAGAKIDTAAAKQKQQIEQTTAAVKELIKSLQEQVRTFGMTERQKALFKLGPNVTQDQLAAVNAWYDQLDILNANKETMDDLAKSAARWREEIETPLDKFDKKSAELRTLLATPGANGKPLITQDEFDRAMKIAEKERDDAIARDFKPGKRKEIKSPTEMKIPLMERRFVAGFREPKTEDRKVKLAERTAKATEQGAKYLQDVATNLAFSLVTI